MTITGAANQQTASAPPTLPDFQTTANFQLQGNNTIPLNPGDLFVNGGAGATDVIELNVFNGPGEPYPSTFTVRLTVDPTVSVILIGGPSPTAADSAGNPATVTNPSLNVWEFSWPSLPAGNPPSFPNSGVGVSFPQGTEFDFPDSATTYPLTLEIVSPDGDNSNNVSQLFFEVAASADISTSVNVNPATPVNVGDNVTLTITVDNNGPDEAGSVFGSMFIDPADFTFVSSGGDGTFDGGTGQWLPPGGFGTPLSSGGTYTYTVVVSPVQSGNLSLVPNHSSFGDFDPDSGNNLQLVNITVN